MTLPGSVKSVLTRAAEAAAIGTATIGCFVWIGHLLGLSFVTNTDAIKSLNAQVETHETRFLHDEARLDSIEAVLRLEAYFLCVDHARKGDVVLPPPCTTLMRGR